MLISIWKILKSKKLAYNLIILLLLECLIGALLPTEQASFLGSRRYLATYPVKMLTKIGLLPFFSSWLFLGTMGMVFINTFCCTITQVFRGARPLKIENWGSVIFHISLLTIIFGAILTIGVKFEGNLVITEGETWRNQEENYLAFTKGSFFKPWMANDFELYLEDFTAKYPKGGLPQQLTSMVKVAKQGVIKSQESIRVAKPLNFEGYTIYQSKHGYAPEFRLTKSSGDVVLEAVVGLSTNSTKGEEYEDEIIIPNSNLSMTLRFLPDIFIKGEDKVLTRSLEPKNPGLEVTIRNEQRRVIFHGPLLLEKEIKFEDYKLKFTSYRHWSGLTVVFDPGYKLIFAGFLLGTAGLILIFYKKLPILSE